MTARKYLQIEISIQSVYSSLVPSNGPGYEAKFILDLICQLLLPNCSSLQNVHYC